MTTKAVPSSTQALKQVLLEAVSHEVRSWKVAQREAAQRLGTDRVALNRILRGTRTPSLEALLSYADSANIAFQFTLHGYTGEISVQSRGSSINKNAE